MQYRPLLILRRRNYSDSCSTRITDRSIDTQRFIHDAGAVINCLTRPATRTCFSCTCIRRSSQPSIDREKGYSYHTRLVTKRAKQMRISCGTNAEIRRTNARYLSIYLELDDESGY